jgi:hypothetical protein
MDLLEVLEESGVNVSIHMLPEGDGAIRLTPFSGGEVDQ